MAIAENDLVLNGAKESRDFEEFHKTKSGSLARTTKTSLDQQHSVTQVGTQVSGKEVVLSAGHDVKAKGIQAIADDNLHVQAGHDVDIAADTNHFKNKRVETKKTRGVFTDGGIGFTVGSQSEKHDYETEGWTQSDARSTLGSMNGNIRVSAGNHTNVLGTDMITPRTNQIDIEGASVKVEAGKDIIERKEGHEYKQSGVTIALSTPVTDMAQAAYNSVNRSQQVTNGKLKALYAVKAAEEATMAAQNVGKVAETLDALRAGNMQNTGTTSSPSVKISLGYGSQKQTQSSESQSISHQKSTVSTGTFNVKARDEKLTFEGVDANAKLMALSGKKGIEIKGVKDEEHQRTENKSAGGSVGVFVGTNGNSYGVGIEGSVNAAKGKSNSDSERWQNSHFTADKIITNSEEGGLTLDAANLKAKCWEANIQNLTITSRQDTEKYESKQTSASASGSVAQGSGGSASVSASYNKAKVDYAQVNEQAGIRVGEDGMDANIHNHTQLNGAIVESDADASKNRFKTKSLTHTDIENRSEIKTESASMGAGTGGINPMQAISSTLSLLGNTNESARSTTQSAISDNIQIDTETPEKLSALSRDTKNANQRVEKQDLQKVQERQEMAKVIGDISNNAISIATYNEREKINKLSLEKFKAEEKYGKASTQAQEIGKQITAIQNDIDGTYGIGSKTGMAIRAVTAALQAAAQNDTAGSLVALASPYLNQKIHEMTAGDTAKDKATNLMAHALLSAVEFQVTGKDPLTGAIAGVTGEATAEIIARAYGKPVSELTANEKENISTLSQLAGGLAAALTAKANGTTVEQGGSFLAATSGAETAKRAVENNLLSKNEDEELFKISEKFEKEKELKQKEKNRGGELLKKDSYINFLIRLNQKDPSQLTEGQKNYLAVELHKIARSWNVPVSDLYNWDFSKEIKRNDSALTKYLSDEIKFWDSYVGKQAQSFAIGALAAGGSVAAVRVIPKAAGYLQETAVFSARNPVAAEILVTGGYKAGEISYKAHSGQYKTEDEFKSAIYDGAKDVIKVPLLSKLKPGAQALNSFAFDLMYEVNKPGATDRQIKTEMLGSSAGSLSSLVVDGALSGTPNINPAVKIFSNVIIGGYASDKSKSLYQNSLNQHEEKK